MTLNVCQFIDGPSQYIASLPGKGVRSKITDAMNVWYEAPESAVVIIKRIIDLLHQASLMLDDLQDGSLLRRGKPATHTIFGMGQTVNSASYKICEALQEVLKLDSIECVRIVIEDSKALYVGQSLDLHWTTNLVRPTLEQYLAALDKSTGLYTLMLFCHENLSLQICQFN
jgi:geranylgeranyl pyrophosphate synthase